jgi:hypothetical protein
MVAVDDGGLPASLTPLTRTNLRVSSNIDPLLALVNSSTMTPLFPCGSVGTGSVAGGTATLTRSRTETGARPRWCDEDGSGKLDR